MFTKKDKMRLLLSLIFLLSVIFAKSQILKGDWEGIFITADSTFWDSIKLKIEWVNNAYVVKSYSKEKDNFNKDINIVCKMDYKLISNDSLVLYEKDIIDPIEMRPQTCYQTMELKYKTAWYVDTPRSESTKELWGIWYCYPEKKEGYGFVRFKKNKYR